MTAGHIVVALFMRFMQFMLFIFPPRQHGADSVLRYTTATRRCCPVISRARGDAAATRPGPTAKGERGTGFPCAAAGPPLHRQRSQIRLCRSAPLPRDFGPGRSAAASTLGRRCAARWALPFAPAGRWLREDCGQDPHRRSLMASGRDDRGGSRQGRSRPHLPRGGVRSRVAGSICDRRQAASRARLCSRYGGGGKGSLDPAGGNRRAAGAPCA